MTMTYISGKYSLLDLQTHYSKKLIYLIVIKYDIIKSLIKEKCI